MRRVGAALAIAAAILVSNSGEAAPVRHSSQTPGSEAPVLFVADEVQYDEELGLIVAKGHVELSQKNQSLLADTVTYNQKTDTVTASGHVSLLQPTGEVLFGDFIELHNDLRDGFIQNIRMLLSDRSRLAGNTGRRLEGNRTELRRGVYSPCDLCKDDPTRPPTWQIKAAEVIHDKEEQIVEYRDAILEIDGFPVFYTPYLSHPDPSVKRQSGFLAPVFGSSSSLGAHFSIPYYWVLGPDNDATIRPIFTTNEGQVLSGQYRQRFADGYIDLNGSVADSEIQDGSADSPGPRHDVFRGHFFGRGQFDLSDTWRTAFDINRTTDQTYTRLFHFGGYDPYLQSRAYTERFDDRSYAIIDNYVFQSLTAGIGDTTQPIVLPVATYNWISHPDDWGGRWRATGNVLDLFRPNGTDIRRVSGGGGWDLPFNGPIGDRFTLMLNMRADGYDSNNSGSPTAAQANLQPGTAGRAYPEAALQWHYPWVRNGGSYSEVIEPIAALIANPNGGNPTTIPAEDNQGFEFDETSLFLPNRFPGYDRVDTGDRVDYGIRTGVYGAGGGSTRVLVGQSYRFQKGSPFAAGSGLVTQRSDVVGKVVVSPGSYLDLFYRFRLDQRDLASRRQEAGIMTGPPSLRLNLSYINIAAEPPPINLQRSHQISGTLITQLTRYWSVGLFGTQNIGNNPNIVNGVQMSNNAATINSGIAATYRDECLTFTTALSHSGTRDRDIHPGTSLIFSIVLKNIGEINLPAFSTGASGAAPVF